jgi:uncharacterized protein YjbI with pentapeptide repeats
LLQNYILVKRLQLIEDPGTIEDLSLFPSLPVIRYIARNHRPLFLVLLWLSLSALNVGFPTAVLCLVQYEFLRYHSVKITSWHQALVVIDLVMAWYLLRALSVPGWRTKAVRALAGLATAGVLFFSLFMAIVPGTYIEAWLEKPFKPADWLDRNLNLAGDTLISEAPPPELLAVFETKDKVSSEESFRRHAVGAQLQGRDLRNANFEGAKLFNADLRGADLRGARLEGAYLSGADLTPLGIEPSLLLLPRGIQKSKKLAEIAKKGEFKRTLLDRAKLRGVTLEDAKLLLVSLAGADLRAVEMAGFELTCSDLRGARLQRANLAGAELSYAVMDGAHLSRVHLEGATLDHASLAGAALYQAQAHAASFASANLEGAWLAEASIEAADFRGAFLAGSDLRRAHLQGATSLRLEMLDLRGAHLGGMCGPRPVRTVDLRFVEFSFLSSAQWGKLYRGVEGRLTKRSQAERKATLARIDAAKAREASDEAQSGCLGTSVFLPATVNNRGLLYFDEQRTGPLASWPPVATQRQGRWDEAAFHEELAAVLLRRACSSPALARALALRAAGEFGPSDLKFDFELASQMRPMLQPGGQCKVFQEVDEFTKKRILWRLHRIETLDS